MQQALPQWVNAREYPFAGRSLSTPHGNLHYLDEGAGPALVMVHGNPMWSFEFRHLVKDLSRDYRCVVPDHLGFGLSDKPLDVAYTPALHAENLSRLLTSLGLSDVVLMVGDWGGPIGLSYAVANPGRVRGIIMTNTWAWPIRPFDLYYQGFSKVVGGPLGRYLIRQHNFFVEKVLTKAIGKKDVLTQEVMDHYRGPFTNKAERKGSWTFPRQITAAHDWLNGIWSRRDEFRHLPFLVLWGDSDVAFRLKELEVWKKELENAEVHVLPGVGHSPAEEVPREVLPLIRTFLARTENRPQDTVYAVHAAATQPQRD